MLQSLLCGETMKRSLATFPKPVGQRPKENENMDFSHRTERRIEREIKIKQTQQEDGFGSSGTPLYKIWKCPNCGHHKVKHSAHSKSSRYWPADDRCNNPNPDVCKTPSGYGKRTRNVLPHVVKTVALRDDARAICKQLNMGLI